MNSSKLVLSRLKPLAHCQKNDDQLQPKANCRISVRHQCVFVGVSWRWSDGVY